ncbi:MAG: biotin synthase BioB, partial [Alistipes ihumii]|nr:biotin synthase BioB [Alistipes ihumii]
IEVYPLVGEQEAVREAAHNASKGVRRFSLVTSGRALSDGETDRVCGIYRRIGSEVDISLCASLGLLSKEQLVRLRQSGVRRYHCNLETAPSYFGELCTTHTQQQKLQTIAWAREAGLEICCGGIIGMGESERQRIEFALAIRDTGAVSVPLNVLNPIPGTRLEKALPLSDRDVLRAAALMQIVNPDASVRLAGGRSRIKHLEPELFRCGVSASIVGDLLTTSGSDIDTDKAMFKKWGFGI